MLNSKAFFSLILLIWLGAGAPAYAVDDMQLSEEQKKEFLESRVDLILHNMDNKVQAVQLKDYRKVLVQALNIHCAAQSCKPEELSLEQTLKVILIWRNKHLDGIALQESGSFLSGDSEGFNRGALLPEPRDECVALVNGEISMEYGFYKERKVRVFIRPDIARQKKGPVVFYWHGSNESWNQVYRVLGDSVISQITNEGGIVFAPHAGSPDALPWHVLNPFFVFKRSDFKLADQLLACAEKEFDIDDGRVYSMGFSAGGLHSAAMGRARSHYIAAIASYSGGQLPWFRLLSNSSPNNFYPAFITYGTEGQDKVPFIEFANTSADLIKYLRKRKFHEVVDCQQTRGHSMPYRSRQAGWDFVKSKRYYRLTDDEKKARERVEVTRRYGDECQ